MAEADLVMVPLVAVTVSVWFPFFALDVTVAVSVAVPPGAMDAGLRLNETPVVPPFALRLTVLLNSPAAVTTT